MAYCVQADVQHSAGGEKKLLRLSDYDGTNAIVAATITNAIEQADALINSYIKKRYLIPLVAPVPDTIKWLSSRGAVFNMARDQGMVSDKMLESAELDMKWLDAVRKGEIVLDAAENPAGSQFDLQKNEARLTTLAVSRATTKGFW